MLGGGSGWSSVSTTSCSQGPCTVSFVDLTCGYGGKRPESVLLSNHCALHLHGEHSLTAEVRTLWRSVCRRDSPDAAPDRSLSTAAFEEVNCLSDDFARALLVLLHHMHDRTT